MTATTEPPWLHKSQGVAPRNGTLSHTLNFTTDGDAPFTPATGSLLVLFIFGAVTHTNAVWTEVEQPVNSGELSCFTQTARAAGADDTVTITHNGSNYPTPWVVIEYPAGSSVTNSTNSSTNNDTFPTLSGLTGGSGNERVIHGAIGRTAGTVLESSFSASWTAPWVEDCDQFAAYNPTDGGALTVGHQINVIATSETPTFTPTYGGTWSTGDREKVVIAVNAVPVGGSSPFTKDVSEVYRVFNAVTKDVSDVYRVLNAFTKNTSEAYRVTNSWTKDQAETYRVLNAFQADKVERYRIFGTVTKDVTESYRVLGSFTKNNADVYRVFNGFTKDITDTWTVLNNDSFVKDVAESWRVYNVFSADQQERYRILGPWALDKVDQYRVTNGWQLDRGDSWRLYGLFSKDVVERYRVFTDTPTPPLRADATAYLEDNATAWLYAEQAVAYL